MTFSKKALSLVAACSLFAAMAAGAAPLIVATPGHYAVGDTVTFVVSDADLAGGTTDIAGFAYYNADILITYDPLTLLLQGVEVIGLPAYGLAAPLYDGSASPATPGSFVATVLSEVASVTLPDLFRLTFSTLPVSSAASVTAGPSPTGAYGDGTSSFVDSSDAVEVTAGGGGTVPEPTTWALSGLALFAAFAARRRSR